MPTQFTVAAQWFQGCQGTPWVEFPLAMGYPSSQVALAWDWARALPPGRHWVPAWWLGRRWPTAFCIEARSTPLMDTPMSTSSLELTPDLGGNDFGIGNADSWDDNSSDLGSMDIGGSDW